MLAGVDFALQSQGGANLQVKVWDADSGKVRASFDAPRGGAAPAFSPDGKRLAYGTQPTIVWDLERQVEVRRFSNFVAREFRPFGRHVAAITVNPDGITDLETGLHRQAPFLDRSEFALSPDGKTVAFVLVSLHPMPLVLWDWITGEQRLVLGQYLVSSLAFSPDGKTLAGATRDGSIRLWQVSTGDELFSLPAPPDGIHELTFAPDSRGLLGRDRDSLYLWRCAGPY